jgi:hypothetical protein
MPTLYVISPNELGGYYDILCNCVVSFLFVKHFALHMYLMPKTWLTTFYKQFAYILLVDLSSNILHAIQVHMK